MTPKGKQDYVRRITERAREFMESSRKKKMRELEKERVRELLESSGSKEKKKKEDVLMMGICVWWTKCKREKKGTYGRKKRKRIRNHNLKIMLQYFHNIFTINFK